MYGQVDLSVEKLKKSGQQFQKELLIMPTKGLATSSVHMSMRTGIRGDRTTGELSGDLQLGPHKVDRVKKDNVKVEPRTLTTYFGSVVQDFEPQTIAESIWGESTMHGEGLKTLNITLQVLNFLALKLGKNLDKHLWDAVRNPTGDTSKELFNGFDTITAQDIAAGRISTAKKNLFEFSEGITKLNAVETLKEFYRSADDELKGEHSKMFITHDMLNAYQDDYKATTGSIAYNTKFEQTILEGSNGLCELVPLSNKKGSPFVHLTRKSNMLIGMDLSNQGDEKLDVEKYHPFVLLFVATKWFGVQFETVSPERFLVGKLFNPQP